MLLDFLSGYEISVRPAGKPRAIGWCTLLPGHLSTSDNASLIDGSVQGSEPSDQSPEVHAIESKRKPLLYLACFNEVKRAFEVLNADTRCSLLVVDEHMTTLEQPFKRYGDRIIVIRETPEIIPQLLSDIQNFIFDMESWSQELNQIIAHEGTLQALIDAAEPILDNHINVSDRLFNLLAASKKHPPQGILNTLLVEEGFHNEDYIEGARTTGIFAQWKRQKGVVLYDPTPEIPVPFATDVITMDGEYLGHVVILFTNTEPTAGKLDAFTYFCNECRLLLTKLNPHGAENQAYIKFFDRLIEDSHLSASYIREQAHLAKIPTNAVFCFGQAEMRKKPSEGWTAYIASRLKNVASHVVAYAHESTIYMLTIDAQQSELAEKLESFCNEYDCNAYLSDQFSDLKQLSFAARQVRLIQQHRESIALLLDCENDADVSKYIYSFTDSFNLFMLNDEFDEAFKSFSVNWFNLERMIENDIAHKTGDVAVLYWYLFYERKPTPTASRLHMHRNNIIYRISRIESRYELNLDLFAQRQRIIKTFWIKASESDDFRELL